MKVCYHLTRGLPQTFNFTSKVASANAILGVCPYENEPKNGKFADVRGTLHKRM